MSLATPKTHNSEPEQEVEKQSLSVNQQLYFDLTTLPHPYSENIHAKFEAWGSATLYLLTAKGRIDLLEVTWNLDDLADWYAHSEHAIINSQMVFDGHGPLPTESLAQALTRLRNHEFPESEEEASLTWDLSIDRYYRQHALRFAFPGLQIPDIIMGRRGVVGEVSCDAATTTWSYEFDLDSFAIDLRQKLISFLSAWASNSHESITQERAAKLINVLSVKT